MDQANEGGATPLYIACRNGHEACARLLLEQGAAVDQAAHDGGTPLIIACQLGHEACARLLLSCLRRGQM